MRGLILYSIMVLMARHSLPEMIYDLSNNLIMWVTSANTKSLFAENSHNLANWLTNKEELPVAKADFFVKNFLGFIERLKNTTLQHGENFFQR